MKILWISVLWGCSFAPCLSQTLDDVIMMGNKQDRQDARKKKKGKVLRMGQSHWDPNTQSYVHYDGDWTDPQNQEYRFDAREWEKPKHKSWIRKLKWKKKTRKSREPGESSPVLGNKK